jgi:hypothetical protein
MMAPYRQVISYENGHAYEENGITRPVDVIVDQTHEEDA